MTEKDAWRRFEQLSRASSSEWDRHINDVNVQNDIRRIRKAYRLPIAGKRELTDWRKSQDEERKADFEAQFRKYEEENGKGSAINLSFTVTTKVLVEIKELAKKYHIDWDQWGASLHDFILYGYSSGRLRTTLVGSSWQVTEDGKLYAEPIITRYTDMDSPINRREIKEMQRGKIIVLDPLPERLRDGRKLDWSPIWEWYQRNQLLFTYQDIAKMMKLAESTVRSALSQLTTKL